MTENAGAPDVKPETTEEYRMATDGELYRIERLRPKWFGLWGPRVWRRVFALCYQTHQQAAAELSLNLRRREGWKDAGIFAYPPKPEPPPAPPRKMPDFGRIEPPTPWERR